MSATDLGNPSFHAIIDELVAGAAGMATSFDDLLRRLPGIWPPTVRGALDLQVNSGQLHPAVWTRLQPQATVASPQGNPVLASCSALAAMRTEVSAPHHLDSAADHGIWLPAPHPLDYDWRFSQRTVVELLNQCLHQTRPGETIALLGTPSLLRGALQHRHVTSRRFVLLDRSHATIAGLAALAPAMVAVRDLATDPLHRHRTLGDKLAARLVIADPPWYSPHIQAFLWAAAQLTTIDGRVLVSLPPVGTRPGVVTERAADLSFAEQIGLEVVEQQPAALEYISPPFERRALAAAGLGGISAAWRRGDLVELRRTTKAAGGRPPPPAESRWIEVGLGVARVRFLGPTPRWPSNPPQEQATRRLHSPLVDPRLVGLVPGDVLPTVSRRDPIRSRIAVWTGQNRVYGSASPGLAARIALALTVGEDPISAATHHVGRSLRPTEEERIRHTADQLSQVTKLEMSDITLGRDNEYAPSKPDRIAGRDRSAAPPPPRHTRPP